MKIHERLYAPEEAPSSNGSNAPATLTYNYGGETITVDLSNPDSVKLAQDRLSKGHNMEKIAEERNRLKEQVEQYKQTVDSWNARLAAAKDDETARNALISDFEQKLGIKLTRQEKQDLTDAEIDFDDPVAKRILALEKRIVESEQKREQREKQNAEEAQIRSEAQRMIAELDAMEGNPTKYPGFNREAVYEAARKANTDNFEMVYYYLNRDDLLKTERAKVEKEYKELTEKRKAAGAEGDATPAHLKEQPKTFTKIEDVGKSVLEDVRAGKTSFFTE